MTNYITSDAAEKHMKIQKHARKVEICADSNDYMATVIVAVILSLIL